MQNDNRFNRSRLAWGGGGGGGGGGVLSIYSHLIPSFGFSLFFLLSVVIFYFVSWLTYFL